MVIYERLYLQHQTKRNNDVAYIIDIFILDNDNAPLHGHCSRTQYKDTSENKEKKNKINASK